MNITILFTKDGCPECEDLKLHGLCEGLRIESLDEKGGLALSIFYNMPVKDETPTPCLYCGRDEEVDVNAVRLYGDALVSYLERRKEKRDGHRTN